MVAFSQVTTFMMEELFNILILYTAETVSTVKT